jgi:hypothetical protein
MSGGTNRIIEEESPIETGQRVGVSRRHLHAYPGQVRRPVVTPVEGLNAKQSRDHRQSRDLQQSRDPLPGTMPSRVSVMEILSAKQANVVAQAGRVEVPRVGDKVVDPEAVGKAVDSGGRITVTAFMNSECFIKVEKRIIDA